MAGAIALFMVTAISSALQKNNTFDESYHLMRGIMPWRTGNFAFNADHPPLINMYSALPWAWNRHYDIPVINEDRPYYSIFAKILSAFLLYRNRVEADYILYYSRLMIMFLAVALALLIYGWTRRLYGIKGALLSFALCLLCPNIMAHARLVTTDIGITVFYYLAAFCLWRWLQDKTSRRWLVVTGIAFGLAQSAKYSALILYPTFFFVMAFDEYRSQAGLPPGRRILKTLRVMLPRYLLIVGIGILVVVVAYGFQPWYYFKYASLFIRRALHGPVLEKALATTRPTRFFFGQLYTEKVWILPLVAYLIKTPIPMLLAAGAGLTVFLRTRRPANDYAVLLGFPLIYFVFLMASTKYGQMRYLLPMYPFIFTVSASLAGWAVTKIRKGILAAGLCWLVAEHVMIYPHYLAYFNPLVGGPANGHRYLLDSNLDWGQDLKGLSKFMRANGIHEISLGYFGQGDPEYYGIYQSQFKMLPCGNL